MIFIFSVPVDHTFFLANFCTASLASSSSVGVLPKQHPSGGAPTGSSSGGITGYPVSNAVRYENKKINGTGQGPVVAQPGQTPALANAQVAAAAQAAAQVAQAGHQQAGQQAMTMKQNSHSVRPQQIQVQPAQTGMNGIGISDQVQAALTPTGTVGGNGSGGGPPGNAAGATLAPSGGGGANPVPNNSFSGIYNDSADQGVGLDNYHLGTVVPPPSVPRGQPEMSNGMYGQHELVAAISQITVS